MWAQSSNFNFEQMPYLESDNKIRVVSVSEYAGVINEALSWLEPVWIEGEISNLKNWQNIMLYFSVKDDFSVLKCNMPADKFRAFGFEIEDGMQVRVLGIPEFKNKRGELTVNVEKIQLCGEGALKKAYDLLKAKLAEEGLFARKRQIPDFIQKVGVITSKSGVVIQDFRKNLKPYGFQIYFLDARVEGGESPASISNAIQWFNNNLPELEIIILMRGGGSLEDLQGFNNEILARVIFSSKIPVLCGIGHDVNVPIASLVADMEVSTPTATAFFLNKSWENLSKNLPYLSDRMLKSFSYNLEVVLARKTDLCWQFLNYFEQSIKDSKASVNLMTEKIVNYFARIFAIFDKLEKSVNTGLDRLFARKNALDERVKINGKNLGYYWSVAVKRKSLALSFIEKHLAAFDPERNLRMGYSLVFNAENKIIRSIKEIKIGDIVGTKITDGKFSSKVSKIFNNLKD